MKNKIHCLNVSDLWSVGELPLERVESVVRAVAASVLQCVQQVSRKFVLQ